MKTLFLSLITICMYSQVHAAEIFCKKANLVLTETELSAEFLDTGAFIIIDECALDLYAGSVCYRGDRLDAIKLLGLYQGSVNNYNNYTVNIIPGTADSDSNVIQYAISFTELQDYPTVGLMKPCDL